MPTIKTAFLVMESRQKLPRPSSKSYVNNISFCEAYFLKLKFPLTEFSVRSLAGQTFFRCRAVSVVYQQLTKNLINTQTLAWLPRTTWVLKVCQTVFRHGNSNKALCLKKGLAHETTPSTPSHKLYHPPLLSNQQTTCGTSIRKECMDVQCYSNSSGTVKYQLLQFSNTGLALYSQQ